MSGKRKIQSRIPSVIFLAALCFIAVIILMFRADDDINRSNLEYISSFGWQVDEKPVDIAYLTIPKNFDSVFSAYSEVAQSGGFDLSACAGIRVVRYSYTVLNHKDSDGGLIRINIFLSKNKIVCADICSLAPDGFVLPLSDNSGIVP